MYTPKSDVYSIGIVLWELISRVIIGEYAKPFSEYELNYDFQVMLLAQEGKRPTLPENTPKSLLELYTQCVDVNIDVRPNCKDIVEELRRIKNEYQENRKDWDALRKRSKKKSK